MARGSTLNEITLMLRVLLGQAVSPSAGTEFVDHLHTAINMAQESLYDEYDWRFKRGVRDKTLNVGQRYYDFPADMPPENIEKVHVLWNGLYSALQNGIGPEEYNAYNSDEDARSDPPRKWDIIDTGTTQFEVWPIPASAGELRFHGKVALAQMVGGDDVAMLDDNLIALTAASMLESDAEKALKYGQMASRRLNTLRGRMASKTRVIPGEGAPDTNRRGGTQINVVWAP